MIVSTEDVFEGIKPYHEDVIPDELLPFSGNKKISLVKSIAENGWYPKFNEGSSVRFKITLAEGFCYPYRTKEVVLSFTREYFERELFKELATAPAKKARKVLKLYRQSYQEKL